MFELYAIIIFDCKDERPTHNLCRNMAEATPTSEADLVLVRQALQDAESSLKDTREKLSQTEKKLQDEAAARKRAEADAQKEKMDNMHRMQQDQQVVFSGCQTYCLSLIVIL